MMIAQLERAGRRKPILWAAAVLMAAWLLSPMMYAQHLEGYTTNLKAIALMANRGNLLGQDLMSQTLTEFLYYTRAGVVGLLRLSRILFGEIGDWDFRGLMIISFVVVSGCSLYIATRLGGVRWWSAAAMLLLVPSLTEVAFHFNDSLPSAAFAIAGFALVVRWDRPWAYFLAGLLAAGSALCRLDGVLLASAIAGMAWFNHRSLSPLTVRIAAAAVGFLAGLLIGAVLLKATPLDAILISRTYFPGPGNFTTILIFAMFVGLSGAIILPVGLVAELRRTRWRAPDWPRIALFFLVPSLIAGIAIAISTETRYFYPLLTPYVLLYGGRGLEIILANLEGRHRRASLAALGLLAAVVLLPPVVTVVRDGPRSPVGRVWMPALWWRWEITMAENLRRVEAIVARAESQSRLLLISTQFNDDFFLKHRFMKAGWDVLPAEVAFPGCSGFSVYGKGDRLVAHIKTERQYGQVKTSKSRLRALLIDRGLSCPALWQADEALLTLWGDDKRVIYFTDTVDPRLLGAVLPRLEPLGALSARFTPGSLFAWPFWAIQKGDDGMSRYHRQGMFHAFPLSRPELEAIHQSAKAYLRLPLQITPEKDDRFVTFAQYQAVYRPRCKDPDRSDLSDVPLCLRLLHQPVANQPSRLRASS